MKQRLEATHFIEVYNHKWYKSCLWMTEISEIGNLADYLEDTIIAGHKPIALWKIKYK
jgi:hypothetical protein